MSFRYYFKVNLVLSLIGGCIILLETIYSFGLWNEAKYELFNIYVAVGLFFGFMLNIEIINDIAYGGVPDLNHYWIGFCLMTTSFIIVEAVYEFRDYISYVFGFPVNDKILYNWFNVEFPGKIGFPIKIYARIQPTLQISALFP